MTQPPERPLVALLRMPPGILVQSQTLGTSFVWNRPCPSPLPDRVWMHGRWPVLPFGRIHQTLQQAQALTLLYLRETMHLLHRKNWHSPIESHRLRLDALWDGGALLRFSGKASTPIVFLATTTTNPGSAHQALHLLGSVPTPVWEGPAGHQAFDPMALPVTRPARLSFY